MGRVVFVFSITLTDRVLVEPYRVVGRHTRIARPLPKKIVPFIYILSRCKSLLTPPPILGHTTIAGSGCPCPPCAVIDLALTGLPQ
ncbi:hypothetical protein OROGR_025259 [Orobanche gracilis]